MVTSIVSTSILQEVPVETVNLGDGSRLAVLTDPRGAAADRFRHVRMRLQEIRGLTKLQSVLITSPLPEDGKTTTAICLATALAQGGKTRTLLIEADLHRPSICNTLNIQQKQGLAECIEDGLDPMLHLRKIEPMGWFLLGAGDSRGNPTEFLQSDAFPSVIQALSSHFDWIVIDAPPVLPLTDALCLSRHVDATLLVARANRTARAAIEESLKILGKKYVLGILLNGVEGLGHLFSEYYRQYHKPDAPSKH